jgi:hypothetical protein
MNKWKETLLILLISSSFIGLNSFIQFRENVPKYYHTTIPKLTTKHLALNVFDFMRNLIFNELFVHKDDYLIQEIRSKLIQQKVSQVNLFEFGWDFFKPIELIQFVKNGQFYYSLKFKVADKSLFDNKTKQHKQLIFRDGSDGFWIFGQPKHKIDLFINDLTRNVFRYKLLNDHTKQYISTFEKTNPTSKSTIQLSLNRIIIQKLSIKKETFFEVLKPKGFHISSGLNFNQLNIIKSNNLVEILKSSGINYYSVNYLGLEFQEDNALVAMPRFELYLKFKKSISGKSLVRNLLTNKYVHIDYEESEDFFKVGDEILKVKQLDSNKLVVSSIIDDFQLVKTTMNPYITGDPKCLVKITNAGWKSVLFELIPFYKASRIFLENANNITSINSKKKFQVTTISFRRDIDISHELLKFSLSL